MSNPSYSKAPMATDVIAASTPPPATSPAPKPAPTVSMCGGPASVVFAHISDTAAIHTLAFVGGFIDAAGYLKVKGVFTSSITGNLVVACAAVTSLNGVICRSCVCIAFTGAACVSALLAMKLRLAYSWRQRPLAIFLFWMEISMFIAIWAVGIALDDQIIYAPDIDRWQVVLVGCLMGMSMGFHNVAAKETIANCPPTTVMTSTLVNVAGGLANVIGLLCASCCCRLTPPTGPNRSYLPLTADDSKTIVALQGEAVNKVLPLMKPLIWFIVGAIIGAITMDRGTFYCLAIPLALVVFLTIEVFIKDRQEMAKDSQQGGQQDMIDADLPVYVLSMQGTTITCKKVSPQRSTTAPLI